MKRYKKLLAAAVLTTSIFAASNVQSMSFYKPSKEQILKNAKETLFKGIGVKSFSEVQEYWRSIINFNLIKTKDANHCLDNVPLIFFTVLINDVKLTEKLISMGANVNHEIKHATLATPFIILAAYTAIFKFDPTQMTELLIKYGANPTTKNFLGQNAIVIAEYYNLDEMIKVFKKYGYC